MARCCICWLAFCSLLLPFSTRAAETPVSAEFFLQSIEPEPSMAMLYDFLDIYDKNFAACKDTDAYARALTYLAVNGETANVRERLRRLAACTDLADSTRQRLAQLEQSLPREATKQPAQPALLAPPAQPAQPAQLAPPAPPAITQSVAQSPVKSAAPATTHTPEPAHEPLAQAVSPQAASPQVEPSPPIPEQVFPEPVIPEPVSPVAVTPPAPATVAPATVAPATVAPAPVSPAPVAPATVVAEAAVPPVVTSPATAPETLRSDSATRPAPSTPRSARPKKPHRNVLPRSVAQQVAPTIPTPARVVPQSVPAVAEIPRDPEHSAKPDTPNLPKKLWQSDVTSRAVYRTGDEGTSRLFRSETTASLGYDKWTFSATAVHLDAGNAGNNVFAGSYFLGNRQRGLPSTQTAFIPQIAYDGEVVDFALGTTPLGGEVSPLPTFRLSAAYKGLQISAFQESVTDSLLSYTGFRDPFSGARMGRVVKTGLRLGWDDTVAEHWFYGGAVTGAYLYGENVRDNTEIRAELYAGRTFGPFAVGIYNAADHFKTNLNNYTFGHGGYYSPYLAATSVLFVSWEYLGQAGRIKADISSGYLYEETRDSDLYYGTNNGRSGPAGVYKGEVHHRLSVNAGLEGSLNLTDSTSLNAALRVIHAGDFTETRGALFLKWAF